MNEREATQLAEQIMAYWRGRGCNVTVVPERTEYDAKLRCVRYELRSNLVNGKCPDCAAGKCQNATKAA